MAQPTTTVSLADYWAAIRRRWRLAAAITLIGTMLGVLLFAVLPRTYEATAAILVSPSLADPGNIEGDRTVTAVNLDTEAEVAVSLEVMRLASEALGQTDPLAFRRLVRISVPPNTAVLEVTVQADTPEGAQAGANAVAQAYLDNRTAVAKAKTDAQGDLLKAQAEDLSKQLRTARTPVERSALQQSYVTVAQDLRALSTQSLSPGRILNSAPLPSRPSDPSPIVVIGGAFALSLIAGLAAAILSDRRDGTIRSADQAASETNMTALGADSAGQRPYLAELSDTMALLLTDRRGHPRFRVLAVVPAERANVFAAVDQLSASIKRHSPTTAIQKILDPAEITHASVRDLVPAGGGGGGGATTIMALPSLQDTGIDESRIVDAVILAVAVDQDTKDSVAAAARALQSADAPVIGVMAWIHTD